MATFSLFPEAVACMADWIFATYLRWLVAVRMICRLRYLSVLICYCNVKVDFYYFEYWLYLLLLTFIINYFYGIFFYWFYWLVWVLFIIIDFIFYDLVLGLFIIVGFFIIIHSIGFLRKYCQFPKIILNV